MTDEQTERLLTALENLVGMNPDKLYGFETVSVAIDGLAAAVRELAEAKPKEAHACCCAPEEAPSQAEPVGEAAEAECAASKEPEEACAFSGKTNREIYETAKEAGLAVTCRMNRTQLIQVWTASGR